MIISKTPFRISFFGGGTDFPQWYMKHGGAVLSTTIDKYCYLSCRILPPFFNNLKHRIVWSHIESVFTISEILHPAIREGLNFLGYDDSVGIEIHHQGDLPARSGMGSSSAFIVGLLKALTGLKGQTISRHELALKALELEQKVLKESVGSQDQVATAYGGFNIINFRTNGEVNVEPVTLSKERLKELQSHLLLLYTGTTRNGTVMASQAIANISNRGNVLSEMRAMVDNGIDILTSNTDLSEFGRLMHRAWILKRELNHDVSNASVDRVYAMAMKNGAIGGKLLGAGGSGFMCLFVPPAKQRNVMEALSGYLHVPFEFEKEGCHLIHGIPSASKQTWESHSRAIPDSGNSLVKEAA